MDNELVIIGAFLGTGLVAYVIIPGLLVMWDRVLDHMEDPETTGTRECHTDGKEEGDPPLTGCCREKHRSHNDTHEYRFTGPIRGNAITSGKNAGISGSVRPSTPVR